MGGPSAGHRYYETLCMQSVNQAIGRVIRHREDYAAIVLLDARYGRPAVVEALPGWIRDRLAHCPHFPDALSRIVQFFRTKRVSS
jgi:chromosome transmission fidelity protein 1